MGFELPGIRPDYPGLTTTERTDLLQALAYRSAAAFSALEFGMRDYRSALQVVKALYEDGIDCTVAVGGEGHDDPSEAVDLCLSPAGAYEFQAFSADAEDVLDRECAVHEASNAVAAKTESTAVPDRTPTPRDPAPGSPLDKVAGATLVILLGFAVYSFLSPALMAPITGLSTIGGFVGAVIAGPLLFQQITADPSADPAVSFVAWDVLTGETLPRYPVVLIPTFLAYLYPTGCRVGGLFLTGDSWLFGPPTSVVSALLSVTVFVGMVFLGTLAGAGAYRRYRDDPGSGLDEDLLWTLVYGHLLYAVAIFVATGLADSVWYDLIPAVAG